MYQNPPSRPTGSPSTAAASHWAKSRAERGWGADEAGGPGAIKGGSFLCADNYCARFRPAARQAQDLTFGTSHIGFRVARDAAIKTGD